MAQEINRIVPSVLAEIFMDVVLAHFLNLRYALRIFAGKGLFFVGIAAGHEHISDDASLHAGENRAHMRVPAMAHVSDALAINVWTSVEQVNAAAQIGDLMHGGFTLLFCSLHWAALGFNPV